MRRLQLVAALGAVGAILTLVGCATIMHGSSQQLSITSTPTGARVVIDGTEVGATPFVARLKRKDRHIVRLEMAGYDAFEMPLTRGTSGWVWGNIVFGGLAGLAIDAVTGGMYKLRPDQVTATLPQTAAAIGEDRDVLVVAVVLQPDSGWEPIGRLTRGSGTP